MNSSTKQQILQLLHAHAAQRPSELASKLKISPQALHRHLKDLLDKGLIVKLGTAPNVFYQVAKKERKLELLKLSSEEKKILEDNFSELRATGKLETGLSAFSNWLLRTKQEKSYKSLAESFTKQYKEVKKLKHRNGLYDLLSKVKSTVERCHLDGVYCQDFYSLPQFGITYLGNLLTAAKSGQDRKSFLALAESFKPILLQFLSDYRIDALCWIPHSMKRNLMILDSLKNQYQIALPEIKSTKVFAGGIPVAQKSLSKLQDRIENARGTIFLLNAEKKGYHRILLIDDALGSGATMNEVAQKVRHEYEPDAVLGLAIVGSYKGFDVMSVV